MIKIMIISIALTASMITTLQSETHNPFFHHSAHFKLDTDLYEQDNNVIARMQVPGIDPEKIEITIENNVLKVSGKREEEKEVKGKNFYSKEIKSGSFERVVKLPEVVEADKATATYKDGDLIITMPKRTDKPAGKVTVTVNKN